jgi:hypothetical protein
MNSILNYIKEFGQENELYPVSQATCIQWAQPMENDDQIGKAQASFQINNLESIQQSRKLTK